MLRVALLGIGILMTPATGIMAQKGLLSRPTPVLPTVVHPAPLGVTVSGRAPRIAVTWQPVPGALDYTVLRSADPAQPGSPVSAALTTPTFVDQSAAPGTVYFYTVTARFSAGPASTSTAVRFDPPSAAVKSGLPTRGQSVAGGSGTPVNDSLPAITGVSDTIIRPGGPPVSIRGRNLWGVTAVYFGTGRRGSYTNPRLVPTLVSQAGDEVQVGAPAGCMSRGPVELEQTYTASVPSSITYITQAVPPTSQVRLNCAGQPVVGLPISAAHPGGSVVYQGSYLSWVTKVTNLGDGFNLNFQILSDNQISVNVPNYSSQQYFLGQVTFQPYLISPMGSSAATSVVLSLPPIVTSAAGPELSPGQITPVQQGGVLEITGYGLIGVSGPISSVIVDGRSAAVLGAPRPNTIAVTAPAGTGNGTFTVSTLGGSASGTFPLMVGPSLITGIAQGAARVSLIGQNLFGALGVCFPSRQSTPSVTTPPVVQPFFPGPSAPVRQQWTNTSVTVDVPPGAMPGPLSLYIPDTPQARTGTCRAAGPLLVWQ